MKKRYLFTLFLLVGTAIQCSKSEEDSSGALLALLGVESAAATEENVIRNYVNHIVLPVYLNLRNASATLHSRSSTLASSPSEANLIAAQNAWKAARVHWENSEAFLFGPVDTEGYDPRIDSWPLDKTDLDQAVSNGVTNVESQGDNIRGFHTAEYLLFDDGSGDGNKGWTAINPNFSGNKRNYLAGVTDDIKFVTATLYSDWVNGFAAEMLGSIDGSSLAYPTTKAALQEMVTGMQTIVDEVYSGKIGDPESTQDVTTVESRYAWNSRDDFANNIRGVKIVWTGDYNGHTGPGLDEFVAARNPALASKVTSQIDAAISAILAIPQPFRNNLSSSKVDDALTALSNLRDTIDNELAPLISNL